MLGPLETLGALPDSALIQSLPEHLAALEALYQFQPDGREMLRMAVSARTFRAPSDGAADGATIERISAADAPALAALYALYPENHFRADLLQNQVLFGIRSHGQIVAAGGTHVVAPAYGVAVLGNIFTHPDAR